MTAQDSKLYRCPKWKTCGLRCIPNHAVSPHVEVDSCSGTARGCPACVPVTKPKLDKIKEIADEASAKNERDFVHSKPIQPPEIMPLVKIYQNPDGLTMWEKGYNTGVLDQNIQDTPILEKAVADAKEQTAREIFAYLKNNRHEVKIESSPEGAWIVFEDTIEALKASYLKGGK